MATRSIAAAAAATSRFGVASASRSAMYCYQPRTLLASLHGDIGNIGNVRFKSAPAVASGGCPFTGSKTNEPAHPKLVQVPTLPFFGSTITKYSGTPPMDVTKLYDFSRGMKERFGEFYSYGMPGFGKGLHGILHAVTDPTEMLKVIRAEGSHPSGTVQQIWPLVEAFKHTKSPLIDPKTGDPGLLGQGERWKAQRTFFQTGMLDPRAARAYVPGIVGAAELASKGAPSASKDNKMNYYLNLCAFDMFSSVMFGELTQCADQNSAKDDPEHDENVKFCQAAMKSMELSNGLLMSPLQNIAYRAGYKTQLYKDYMDAWQEVTDIGLKKVRAFEQKYNSNTLNEYEQNSYMAHALKRLEEQGPDGSVTHGEAMALSLMALFAGVDTTSAVVAWTLMHVALNPKVQQKLYEELKEAVQSTDGKITAKTLEKKSTPYLHAVLRETYRLTPPAGSITVKTASQSSIDIHGETLEQGSVVILDNKYNCEATSGLGDSTMQFQPERWSPENIEKRVGTPLQAMDHALFRDNFGQGARRCPGSRVATNEVLIMLAQLVLDYDIKTPASVKTLDDVPYSMTALLSPKIPQLTFTAREEREDNLVEAAAA